MDRIVLPFERENITVDEMLEHANWYMMKSDEGNRLKESGDNRSAMDTLKEINNALKLEYHHYGKVSVSKYIDNKISRTYKKEIGSCLTKQNKTNSYDRLNSNLYDIWSYANSFVTYVENL